MKKSYDCRKCGKEIVPPENVIVMTSKEVSHAIRKHYSVHHPKPEEQHLHS